MMKLIRAIRGAILLGAIVLCACSVRANVMPEAVLVLHIPGQVEGQGLETITSCDDVVGITSDTGSLWLDVYFHPLRQIYFDDICELKEVEIDFRWPSEWDVVSWRSYSTLASQYTQNTPTRGHLHLHWGSPPELLTDLYHLGRLHINATSRGALVAEGFAQLSFPSSGPEVLPSDLHCRARFGYPCSTCSYGCRGVNYCTPHVSSNHLKVKLNDEGLGHGEFILSQYSGAGPSSECPNNCEITAHDGWVAIETEEMEWPNTKVTLTVDGTNLSPGIHETWVECYAGCSKCVLVEVSVGQRHAAEGTPATWGQMKALFVK